jgi:hypothetical protein
MRLLRARIVARVVPTRFVTVEVRLRTRRIVASNRGRSARARIVVGVVVRLADALRGRRNRLTRTIAAVVI